MMLQVSTSTMRRWTAEGRITPSRFGDLLRYKRKDIEAIEGVPSRPPTDEEQAARRETLVRKALAKHEGAR